MKLSISVSDDDIEFLDRYADERGLGRDSKAQAEQVRSISVDRIGARISTLRADQLHALDEALRLHLAA